jgi:hypothetical protein
MIEDFTFGLDLLLINADATMSSSVAVGVNRLRATYPDRQVTSRNAVSRDSG